MALDFDSTDSLQRTTNLPAQNAFTVCGWARRDASTSFGTLCAFNHLTSDEYHMLQWDSTTDNIVAVNWTGGASATIAAIGNGTWFFWAIVVNGTNVTGYAAARATAALASQSVAYTAVTGSPRLDVGGNRYNESIDGKLSHVRVWSAALTAAEIGAERFSPYPVRRANLNGDYPMRASTTALADNDFSGSGNDWTPNGTLALADGPPLAVAIGRSRRTPFAAAGGGNVTVTPTTASLTTAAFAPVLKFGVTPSTLALTTSRFAPVLKFSVIPPTAALTLSAFAPTVTFTGHVVAVPATLALTTSAFAPVLKLVVTPTTKALVTAAFAPRIGLGVVPATVSLTTSLFAPTLISGVGVIPGTVALVTARFAPTLLMPVVCTPTTKALLITTFAPSIVSAVSDYTVGVRIDGTNIYITTADDLSQFQGVVLVYYTR